MRRIFECMLAGIGAFFCVAGAANIWLSQTSLSSPNISLWPLPALILIEIAILGLAGFSGMLLDDQQHSSWWGRITWIACGGLAALAVIGAIGVSVVVLLAIPAVLFGAAAILADIRQHRNILTNLAFLAVSAIANLALIFALISLARI